MRSRLYPHRDAIAEALDAGTSVRTLARTYGVHHSTMQQFIGARKDTGSQRSEAWRKANTLRKCQYDSLRYARNRVELSRQRAEESWL